MARQTIYEPHPVSPERKAELQAKGYRIVDARFAPADAKVAKVEPEKAPEPVVEAVVEAVAEVAPEPVAEAAVEPEPAPEPKKRGRPAKVASDA